LKIVLGFFMVSFLFAGFPEYYYKLPIKKQKIEFKKILLPMIEKENKKILYTREKIKSIFKDPFFTMDKKKILYLAKIAKIYKLKDIYNKKAFLTKIDIIPKNLILAQGAIESAWGRSYFVKKANNIFGQWDYSGKGMIPRNRKAGATHTIRVFKNLQESLSTYMRNLNRNPAYREFRTLRAEYRDKNKTFNGFVAATTLHRYSELGHKYVKIVQTMVRQFKGN